MIDKIPAYAGMTILCVSLSTFASAKPMLERNTNTRDKFEEKSQELGQARELEKELAKQSAEAEKGQKELQQSLVKLTREQQQNEKELSDAEKKFAILKAQATTKSTELATHRKELSAMMEAAVRLSQMPPEAAIMMPGEAEKTLTAARMLRTMAESIQEKTAKLDRDMEELNRLKQKVQIGKQTVELKQGEMKKSKEALDASLKERKALFTKVNREHEQAKERTRRLAQESQDLKGLLFSLEKEEREQPRKSAPKVKGGRSFANAKGHLRVPVSGSLIQGFGGTIERAEMNKGLIFETRRGAQVSAPFDGEVVFTGPFLDYGKIVILRHGEDFHTLLAGISSIDVSVGEFLLEGEPIGAMSERESPPKLYVELRKNNQPIDPAPWMANLSKPI